MPRAVGHSLERVLHDVVTEGTRVIVITDGPLLAQACARNSWASLDKLLKNMGIVHTSGPRNNKWRPASPRFYMYQGPDQYKFDASNCMRLPRRFKEGSETKWRAPKGFVTCGRGSSRSVEVIRGPNLEPALPKTTSDAEASGAGAGSSNAVSAAANTSLTAAGFASGAMTTGVVPMAPMPQMMAMPQAQMVQTPNGMMQVYYVPWVAPGTQQQQHVAQDAPRQQQSAKSSDQPLAESPDTAASATPSEGSLPPALGALASPAPPTALATAAADASGKAMLFQQPFFPAQPAAGPAGQSYVMMPATNTMAPSALQSMPAMMPMMMQFPAMQPQHQQMMQMQQQMMQMKQQHRQSQVVVQASDGNTVHSQDDDVDEDEDEDPGNGMQLPSSLLLNLSKSRRSSGPEVEVRQRRVASSASSPLAASPAAV